MLASFKGIHEELLRYRINCEYLFWVLSIGRENPLINMHQQSLIGDEVVRGGIFRKLSDEVDYFVWRRKNLPQNRG